MDEIGAAANATDRDASAALRAILLADDHAGETAARAGFFLTGTGEIKARSISRRFSAGLRKMRTALEGDFTAEAERLLGL